MSNKRGKAKEFSNLGSNSYKSISKSKSKSKTKAKQTNQVQASNGNFIVINFLNSTESVDSSPLVNIVVQKNAK